MHDNEFETKGNKIWTKDKIESQNIQYYCGEHLVALRSMLRFFMCLVTLWLPRSVKSVNYLRSNGFKVSLPSDKDVKITVYW